MIGSPRRKFCVFEFRTQAGMKMIFEKASPTILWSKEFDPARPSGQNSQLAVRILMLTESCQPPSHTSVGEMD